MLGCFFGFVLSQVVSGAALPEPAPFIVDQEYAICPSMQPYLWITADTTDLWTIETASAEHTQAHYEHYPDYMRKYERLEPRLSYWGKIRIKSTLSYDTKWLLELSPKNSFVDVYIRQPDGTFTSQHTGQYLPFSKRATKANVRNSVWISLPSGQVQEIYIKVKRITGFRPRFGLVLTSPQYWIHRDVTFNDFTTGFIEGALCIVALFFLFYYTTTNDKTYFYYALFLLTTAVYYLFDYQHYYTDVLLGDYIHLKLYPWLLASVFFVFLILFVRSFLNIPQRFPGLDRIFRLMIGVRLFLLTICLGILYWRNDLALVDKLYATPLNNIEVILWIGIIIYLIRQRSTKADRFMLLGVSLFVLCVGSVLLTFQIPGLHQYWIPYFYHVGLASQVVCLSIALGIRQRIDQQEALLLKTKMNEQLEEKVQARTREIDQQRQQLLTQAGELQNLNRIRSHLLANISHEFRTPLTLIINPLERLIQADHEKELSKAVSLFRQMKWHAQSLLYFVDQLLMLSRIESNAFTLQRESADIVSYLRPVLFSFYGLAERQQIHYRVQLPSQPVLVDADLQKITIIVNNLLSNAFKFTPRGGKVAIRIQVQQQALRLSVQDSGIGIDPQEHASIFDRFYQSENGRQHNVTGTGIGLSLIREIVKLHQGTITLESQLGKGATFTISLPIVQETKAPRATPPEEQVLMEPALSESQQPAAPEKAPSVLIVEDNPYMQQHLRECLQDHYRLLLAADGKEGQAIAEEQLPDLIVTDLAMPLQDGIQLTQALKENVLTSHIPIILLTARADRKHQASGWQHGADAYITKPFDMALLQIRMKNLLDERARLRAHYLRQFLVNPAGLSPAAGSDSPHQTIAKTDPFLDKLTAVIEAHYEDSTFDVEALSEKMSISSSQLNRKLKAIIHQSTVDFIRSYRLRKGAELLHSSDHTVAEIAYMVGFSSPSYFTRRFREQFGCPPSQHQKYGQPQPDAR